MSKEMEVKKEVRLSETIEFWQGLILRDMKEVLFKLEVEGFNNSSSSRLRLLTDSLNNYEGIDQYFRVNDLM